MTEVLRQLDHVDALLAHARAGRHEIVLREMVTLGKTPQAPRAIAVLIIASIQAGRPELLAQAGKLLAQLERAVTDVPTTLLREALGAAAGSQRAHAQTKAIAAYELLAWLVATEKMHVQGRTSASMAAIEGVLGSDDLSKARSAALFAATKEYYALNSKIVHALGRSLEQVPRDVSALHVRGHGCWQLGQHEQAVRHAREVLAILGPGFHIHRSLGLYLLSAGKPQEALANLVQARAVLPLAQQVMIADWIKLAEMMARGETTAVARHAGISAKFRLSCCNNIAMESDCNHANASFTEPEELTICASFVPRGATIVEVGTLVGNHTLFFALACGPKKIIALDANPRCVEELRHNLELNHVAGLGIETTLLHAAAGEKAGTLDFPSIGVVPMVALDDIMQEKVDFLKIDVDGGELGVIRGMERLVRESRPRIMIECDRINQPVLESWIRDRLYKTTHVVDHGSYKNWFLVPNESTA